MARITEDGMVTAETTALRRPAGVGVAPLRVRGSIVLVALCLVTVLGVAVVGLLAVCARTMELSNRAFCYTSSTQLAEIGMEEALWSLDQQLNTSGYSWSGWTLATVNGVPTATKTLTGFATNIGLAGTVNISVQYYNTSSSTAYTQPPVITSDGVSQMPDGIQIDKQLKAIVKPAALFVRAVGATASYNASAPSGYSGNVDFYQNTSATVDSYDSSQGSYTSASTTNRSDQAIVSGPYLHFSHTNVYGYAVTANSSATAPATSNSNITTLGGSGISSSRISNNGGQRSFDLSTPSAAGSILPTSGSIGPGFYYYTSGSYSNGGTLTITGPATIYISSGLNLYNPVVISSSSTGPVQFYVGGQVWIDDSSGIDNQTRNPAYLSIFSPTTYSCGLYANTSYYGVVYVPNALLYVWGYNYNNLEVYGSLVGLDVIPYYANIFKLHYDLNLRKTTFSMANTPFEVTEWIEN